MRALAGLACAIAVAADACTADQFAGPTATIPSIVARLDSGVLRNLASGDTLRADLLTSIEIPLVFGAPASFASIALDSFEVQRTYEVNTVGWVAGAYAVVDSTDADTVLTFTAADDDNGDAVLRSVREGSNAAAALIAGDSLYFGPQPAVVQLVITGAAGKPCPTPIRTRNPAIVSLLAARCVDVTFQAYDSLMTPFPQPGDIAGIWTGRKSIPGVALIR
jgi:hypothetical protein